MDKILNRICSISDHPVSMLNEKFCVKYVKGLGACLYILMNNWGNPDTDNLSIVKMFFQVWAKSILKKDMDIESIWRNDISAIKSAVSIQRKGFHFFSMKYAFFFDIFYLLQSAQRTGYAPTILYENTFTFLKKNIVGFYTKKALYEVYNLFKKDVPCSKIANSLLSHRTLNEKYLHKAEKRILVVANVSAGKSTLINALVGYRLNRVKTTACTNKLAYLHNKTLKDGITVKHADSTYSYFDEPDSINSDDFIHVAFPFNSTLSEENICIIDTPGFNNSENLKHRGITEDAIKQIEYDGVIYISNCQYFGTNDERDLLLFLKKHVKRPILFVLNQLDRFNQKEDSISKMLKDYRDDLLKLGFKSPMVSPVSAKAALLFKLPPEKLDEDDHEDKKMFQSKFLKDYYNLPEYVMKYKSSDMLERTGINYLEYKISRTI